MRIMALRHARVGVTKLFGNNAHRNAAHGECRSVSMSQHMERNRPLDLRPLARFQHWPRLM